MKHTDHPNWKNLSPSEKNNVRQENYKKRDLKIEIEKIENFIEEEKERGKSTLYLESILKRKRFALENNPFNEGDITDNFMEDLLNIVEDYKVETS